MKDAADRSSGRATDPNQRTVMCSRKRTGGAGALSRAAVAGGEGRSGGGPNPVCLADLVSL